MSQINKALSPTFLLTNNVIKLKFKPLLKYFWAFIGVMVFSLLIVAIYQLNVYSAESHFILSAEESIAELIQENKNLEINLARANSLLKVEDYIENFEKVNKIEYIRVLENTAFSKVNHAYAEN